jgi:hypothetical protein
MNAKNVHHFTTVPNVKMDSYMKENVDLAQIPISLTQKPRLVTHATALARLVLDQIMMTVSTVMTDSS